MRRGAIALLVALPWALWAAVRVLGLDGRFPLVAAIAFTPYAAMTSPLPLVVALVLRQRAAAVVAAVAMVALIAVVLPRALDGPAAGGEGRRLVVMTSNLYGGRGDARAVMRLVRRHRVDVLSLQELTPEAVRALDAAGARAVLPGRDLAARPGGAGSGLMARRRLRFGSGDTAAGAQQPESAVSGTGVRVKAVHPLPPVSRAAAARWRRALRALPPPRAGGGVGRILAGDFNATLDHSELREVLDRGYVDAADAAGTGLKPTWPVGRRVFPIAIDHVLVPPGVRVRRVTLHEIPGSDHRALIAELTLP